MEVACIYNWVGGVWDKGSSELHHYRNLASLLIDPLTILRLNEFCNYENDHTVQLMILTAILVAWQLAGYPKMSTAGWYGKHWRWNVKSPTKNQELDNNSA